MLIKLLNQIKTLRCVWRCFFLLFSVAQPLWAAKLNAIYLSNESGSTVVNCRITGNTHSRVFVLHSPERLVIDLPQTTTHLNASNLKLSSNLIKQARIGHPNAQTLRIVFDLNRSTSLKASPMTTSQGLRIPLRTATTSFVTNQNPVVVSDVHESKLAQNRISSSRSLHIPPHSLRDVVVVIDPGHGGHDPGAIGMHHTREKQIVLSIALKLKQLIDKQPGMRAVLTRNGDYYVGLRDRMRIARRYNGDIFVAIHADAFGNHASHGASVFALSQRGATSEAARWLAAKENYSELGGVNLSQLDDQNGVIRTVLIDLSQTATINASLQMGGEVLRRLNQITTLHSTRVEQARFMVLKSPDIPSVLIETGFVSNPGEEAKLSNPAYQARLSQAIMSGLKAYFWDYPPHGSRIEALSGANRRLLTRRNDFFHSRQTS